MSGVNKAILIGNLGRDPEMRYTQDGTPVCSFSIATSINWKDRVTGEKREKTEWHRIVSFRGLAEVCARYLKKGSKVFIEGSLQTRSYEKEGVTHYITEIVANEMTMLDSAPKSSGGYESAPPNPGNEYGGGYNDFPGAVGSGGGDDDIPF
ncbi:MAG: single-stranded DNA-binding protein [Gammaproteobacteria bacterium]|nr:MAG: single-stranded DNA-binding protein [Deltaproteobacteria bacterium]PIE48156.1 MAG: single-stranded DNA-binding protein [Gammaproteobacteria bacterium]